MLEGKNILIIGARSGGYGESIAVASVRAGARVFGSSLTPEDQKEQTFFSAIGVDLLKTPLRFSAFKRDAVLDALARISNELRNKGVQSLDAVVHAVAGGFPRQPSVMKAVGDILKGKLDFSDLATSVRSNVYYVNAGSFEDTIYGLDAISSPQTQFLALTYRGDMPYFISDTKKYLEKIALRLAGKGKTTIIAALPEAWTQSSQFFAGIELTVLNNYSEHLRNPKEVSPGLASEFESMQRALADLDGFDKLMIKYDKSLSVDWGNVSESPELKDLQQSVSSLFSTLRNDGTFPVLRRAVEIISEFVRRSSAFLVVRNLISGRNYAPGEVRQVRYSDLTGTSKIDLAKPRHKAPPRIIVKRQWISYEKDEIRRTLNMYGENFLFLDRVVMEAGEFHEGMMGFARFTVPTPDKNPILKDHFVGMPVFGGHLQMEAVAQFGTFMILKLVKDRRMVPILTGTEFPELNTMAPPGETLKMVGRMGASSKRDMWIDAVIENRFARSRGIIRGMVLNERLARKMLASFNINDSED
jgi:3-hydroxymyristoyl/3-hydroxydecanoyl-(acyl carrier protein) dehydratase